jgi:uncharacterized repeat protein (TIGR02543 family)
VNSSATFGSVVSLPNLSGVTTQVNGAPHKFFGWSDGSTTYKSLDSYVLGETSPQFTALWVQTYEVLYSFGGGTRNTTDGQPSDNDSATGCDAQGLCVNGDTIVLRGAPTRAGYNFDGWLGQDGLVRSAGSEQIITENNYLFYAKWSPKSYSFSFNSMGGNINHPSQNSHIGRILTLPDPGTKTGYSFKGWSPDGGGSFIAAGSKFKLHGWQWEPTPSCTW